MVWVPAYLKIVTVSKHSESGLLHALSIIDSFSTSVSDRNVVIEVDTNGDDKE